MLLNLKLNHFFRSFWSLGRCKELTDIDLKYYDFASINYGDMISWNNNTGHFDYITPVPGDIAKIKDLAKRCKNNYIDISYWNTYKFLYKNTNIKQDSDSDVGTAYLSYLPYLSYNYVEKLLNIFVIHLAVGWPEIVGIANIRIDNTGDELKKLLRRLKRTKINKNWKTANLKDVFGLSQHLNEYKYKVSKGLDPWKPTS